MVDAALAGGVPDVRYNGSPADLARADGPFWVGAQAGVLLRWVGELLAG
jgi:hypothetical protein